MRKSARCPFGIICRIVEGPRCYASDPQKGYIRHAHHAAARIIAEPGPTRAHDPVETVRNISAVNIIVGLPSIGVVAARHARNLACGVNELTFTKRMTNLGKTPDYDNVIAFFEIYGAGVVASSEPPHEAYAVGINGNRLAIRGFELHISVHRDPSL